MKLVVETLNEGHRKEYVEHIISYLNSNPAMKPHYIFFLNENLVESLEISYCDIKIEILDNKYCHRELLYSNIKHYFFIRNLLKTYSSINTILFLTIDIYQLMLYFPFLLRRNIDIEGILFLPFHQNPIENIKSSVKVYRKKLIMKGLFLCNKYTRKIFLLNDEEGVLILNKTLFNTQDKGVFTYLPDPIDTQCIAKSNTKLELCKKYNIECNRKILLVFGGIDERKNTFNIIEALTKLDKETQSNICLLVVGKIYLKNKNKLYDLINQTLIKCLNIRIIVVEGYISDLQREIFFNASDLILMPYINFYSSSGVLGHAIKYNKPVLSSNKGLVSNIIIKNDFGICINPKSSGEIAKGLKELLISAERFKNSDRNKEFLSFHSPEIFSEILLK